MTSYNSATEWKPLASDTARMTRAQLEAAAADHDEHLPREG
jgi:hypothetical protein